jgi:pimeloyl-ACP methyl ester carboxylesterase
MAIHDMEVTTVTTEAVSLHIEQEGSGAPALVFLHYWGGSARTWTSVMDRLASTNRCVAIDQRGWGRSEAPASGYAIRDHADDALGVIAALELDDYVLVGHSMGGKVAQVVAGDRPAGLRGLVLIAPAPAAPAAPIADEFREQLLGAYLTRDGVLEGLEIVGSYQALSPELREQVVSDSMAGAPQARTAWPNIERLWAKLRGHPLMKTLNTTHEMWPG